MINYKDFGVDIDKGSAFVNKLKPLVKETFSPNVLGGLGGFSGCFSLPSGYKNPVLCAATDGVGSKITLALQYNRLESIGIDLVAMCVNDLICDFATPLFFLDYYAMNRLELQDSIKILQSIVDGCKIAKCALIGGESAEMPSIYKKGEFDLAGFAVGMAERDDLTRRDSVKSGDVILGFASSGIHSNGFSLIRGIIDTKGIDLSARCDVVRANVDSKNLQNLDSIIIESKTLLDALLTPTRIYVDIFLKFKDKFKALAHITGGGLRENLVRVLPQNVSANIESASIRTPSVYTPFLPFISKDEAYHVFNMGVGLVCIVDKNSVDSILESSDAFVLGEISSGKNEVNLR